MNSPMQDQPETVSYRPQRDRDTKVGEETEVTEGSRDAHGGEENIFFFLKEAMAGK